MGKPLPDDDVDPSLSIKPDQQTSEPPPRIPPRMKKTKGPALPEKPAHIRAKSSILLHSSQQQQPQSREPLKPRILNVEKSPCREVLVAACKAGRERPVDKRQREPPKLLKPTGGSSSSSTYRKDIIVPPGHLEESWRDATTPRTSGWRLDEYAALSSLNPPLWPDAVHGRSHKSSSGRKPNCPVHQQPVLVVPRHLVTWTPVSHHASPLWTQTQREVGKPALKHPQFKSGTSGTSRGVRSGSVTRSGSLTSQGSSDSESGGEACSFPVSVLKKQKRVSVAPKEVSASHRRMDQKKIVTFNAFATVQVVDD